MIQHGTDAVDAGTGQSSPVSQTVSSQCIHPLTMNLRSSVKLFLKVQ